MELARAGLEELVRRYDDPATPYRSRVAPEWARNPGGEYDHLARVREWSTAEADE